MPRRKGKDWVAEAFHAAEGYVREVVDGVLEAVREAVRDYGQDSDEALQEIVDGYETVIYTGKARVYLLGSDHDEAYEEEMGEPPSSVEVQAAFAIMADVRDRKEWDGLVR